MSVQRCIWRESVRALLLWNEFVFWTLFSVVAITTFKWIISGKPKWIVLALVFAICFTFPAGFLNDRFYPELLMDAFYWW